MLITIHYVSLNRTRQLIFVLKTGLLSLFATETKFVNITYLKFMFQKEKAAVQAVSMASHSYLGGRSGQRIS